MEKINLLNSSTIKNVWFSLECYLKLCICLKTKQKHPYKESNLSFSFTELCSKLLLNSVEKYAKGTYIIYVISLKVFIFLTSILC